jgi:hypothetical protein
MLSLTEIGNGMMFDSIPLPMEHLVRLLKLGFIRAEGKRYVATASGLFQIAHGIQPLATSVLASEANSR